MQERKIIEKDFLSGGHYYTEKCGKASILPKLSIQLRLARIEIAYVNKQNENCDINWDGAYRMGVIMSGFGHPCNLIQRDSSLHFSQPNNDLPHGK